MEELTDMVKNHKLRYVSPPEGGKVQWNHIYCTCCKKSFHIGADMCDADGIVRGLRRISRSKCKKE